MRASFSGFDYAGIAAISGWMPMSSNGLGQSELFRDGGSGSFGLSGTLRGSRKSMAQNGCAIAFFRWRAHGATANSKSPASICNLLPPYPASTPCCASSITSFRSSPAFLCRR